MNNYDNLASIEDLKEQFLEYESGYICDVIGEIVHNNIDIYNYELLSSAWDLYSSGAYDEAMQEFGSSGDMIRDFQLAQYTFYSNLMYENLEEMLQDWIKKNCNFTEEELTLIIENYFDFDSNDSLEDLEDILTEWLQHQVEEVTV